MDDLLEKAKKAVEKFHSKQSGDKTKATKVVLSAVLSCKKYIEENEREDRGIAQRCARDLSEILSAMPLFKSFAFDKKSLSNIHTKSLADEHLDMIQKELEREIKEVEIAKRKKVRDWVRTHPVFGKLRRSASKRLPEGAYVLLFRRSASHPNKNKKDGSKKEGKGPQRKTETLTTEILAASSVTVTESLTQSNFGLEEGHVSLSKVSVSVAECSVSVARTESSETSVSVEETIVQTSESVAVASRSNAMNSSSNVEISTVERLAVMQSVLISNEANALQSELRFSEVTDTSSDASRSEASNSDASETSNEAQQPGMAAFQAASTATMESVEAESQDNANNRTSSNMNCGSTETQAETPSGACTESESLAAAEQPLQNAEDENAVPPEIVLRPSTDGRIFTRFRPREFADETRVYRMFRGGPPIVGACVIAQGKLSNSFGTLPEPKPGGDQLRLLLSLSKEAVGRPGKAFVESHEVLGELFSMCKSRKIHKEAYILLFELAEEGPKTETENLESESVEPKSQDSQSSSDSGLEQDEQSDQIAEESLDSELAETESETETKNEEESLGQSAENAPGNDADAEIPKESESSESEMEASENDDSESDADLENIDAATLAMESPLDDLDVDADDDSNTDDSITEEPDSPLDLTGKIELVSKKADDGRIITRYRSFDFIDSRTLFEGFRNRRPIVGAAVIRERELIKVIGIVPKTEGESQLDTLLNHSRQALEKPSLEFIASNEVLNSLHQQSISEFKQKECNVVLFTETEGRLTLLSLPNKKGYSQVKIPISEFRSARFVHDRFKTEKLVIGASIIGETAPSPVARESNFKGNSRDNKGSKSDNRGDRDKGRDGRDNFRSRNAPRSLVVLAAFGRTPLRQNVLLSPEILKRLGVDLSVL